MRSTENFRSKNLIVSSSADVGVDAVERDLDRELWPESDGSIVGRFVTISDSARRKLLLLLLGVATDVDVDVFRDAGVTSLPMHVTNFLSSDIFWWIPLV